MSALNITYCIVSAVSAYIYFLRFYLHFRYLHCLHWPYLAKTDGIVRQHEAVAIHDLALLHYLERTASLVPCADIERRLIECALYLPLV